jgi:hypothetical protein
VEGRSVQLSRLATHDVDISHCLSSLASAALNLSFTLYIFTLIDSG